MAVKNFQHKTEDLRAAQEECAREPVHIPGAVQSFGVLLSFDAAISRVWQVSANVSQHLGLRVDDCLGASAIDIFGKSLLGRIRRGLKGVDRLPGALTVTRKLGGVSRKLHVVAYRSGEAVIVELEPLGGGVRYRWLSLVNDWISRLVETGTESEVMAMLCEAVRAISGYNRALIYAFDENWNGKVVAESRCETLSPLLGQHFPASDIPPQVRAMYGNNRVRVIADARAEPARLVPAMNPANGQPLDLSSGYLRAVSPIHCDYMQNMGVRSSLSVAIYSETRLWGLVSCHSNEVLALSPSARDSVVTLVEVASQRLFLLKAEADAHYRYQIHDNRVELAGGVQERQAPSDLVRQHAEHWRELFTVEGLALAYLGEITLSGTTPGEDQIRALTNWLENHVKGSEPWATTSLAASGYPGAEAIGESCCGLLAMPLLIDMDARGWLLLFRPEQFEMVPWAGKPDKVPEMRDGRTVLSPRTSFATWVEEVSGKSQAWHPAEINAARDLGDDLAVIAAAHEITRLNEYLRREREALAQANKHLEKVANTDALTGTLNRYRIEHLVQMSLANAERYGQPFSLLLFDLDHFKMINDTYGHEVGDRILKALVGALTEGLREGDQLGRWGGEEFLVLAPNTVLSDAGIFAERLRGMVLDAEFGLDEPVTISIGVTEWRAGDTLKNLLVRADRAMYQAKHSGRNRVHLDTH
ncbi:sensor domain-containing diguanylate cyclase [Marinimicrobium agarilyticum]|uniref:sensor domain-containing diguanylate cyclase n=1 Tax=Marinimicrobium agarilyticum TaxID=306546 RepID=UPI00041477CA|nr:sensor domain-containing diguanylate cyclase [Marinimicrobium agarilyticum]